MAEEFVRQYYKMWKDGGIVTVRFRGNPKFKKQEKIHTPISAERIVGTDTETTRKGGKLVTDLLPAAFDDGETVFDDSDACSSPLADFLSEMTERFGVEDPSPSRTVFRKSKGRRFSPPSVLTTWFNLPYDVSRLFNRRTDLFRLYSGGDKFSTEVGETHTIEWDKYIDASAPQFRWFVRDHDKERILAVDGFDLTGYWKCSLERALKSVGLTGKDDIEAEVHDVHDRPYESFTKAEVKARKDYAATDARQTRNLFEETLKLLVAIDPRVIRQNGLPPSSAPGAAARIMFARAFDLHPELMTWPRPPDWADRLGAQSYFGGRAFCARPGRYEGCVTLDLKSAYPGAMARLPDPCTVEYVEVTPGKFGIDKWRGKFGVLVVSGEALDKVYPPMRVHGKDHLRYVNGYFKRRAFTIPELIIGVARGALRIDYVHDGVWLNGSPEKSFIRNFIVDLYVMKEKYKGTPLGELAKLLMNSSYGKLIQVTEHEMSWESLIAVPKFRRNQTAIAKSILHILANDGAADSRALFFPVPVQDRPQHETAFYNAIKGEGHASLSVEVYTAIVNSLLPQPVQDTVPLTVFLRSSRSYNAGPFFMPVYAAQITGFVSAQLGCLAACTKALAGDTDSVHIQCPSGDPMKTPEVERYFQIMEEAGYPSPREGGFEIEGLTLGRWEAETPCPSTESYLVRPKRYSHYFANTPPKKDGTGGGPVFKQATHGMSRFTTVDAERLVKDGTIAKEDRIQKTMFVRKAAVHDAMRQLLAGEHVTYEKRKAPRKGRTAKRTGDMAGEFVGGSVTVTNPPIPHARLCADGWVRWESMGKRVYANERIIAECNEHSTVEVTLADLTALASAKDSK